MNFLKSTKRKIQLAVGVIVVLLVVFVIVWSQSSSTGTVTTQYYTHENQTKYKTLDGKTFSLEYDSRYAVGTPNSHNSDVEDYTLLADTVYDKRLAISVSPLPSGKLTDDSDYNLRLVHPELYTLQTQRVPAGTATLFIKGDNSEQTVFLEHKGLVMSLAFTTTGASDQLTPEVNHLLGTFRWK